VDYDINPYPGYTTDPRILLPCCYTTYQNTLPYKLYNPKDHTLVVMTSEDTAQLYPYKPLASYPILNQNNSITNDPFVVVYHNDAFFAAAYSSMVNGTVLTFQFYNYSLDGFILMTDQETLSVWDMTGVSIMGPLTGQHLSPVPNGYYHAYWFGAISLFPYSPIFNGQLTMYYSPICPLFSPLDSCVVPCTQIVDGIAQVLTQAINAPQFISAQNFQATANIPWENNFPYVILGAALASVILFGVCIYLLLKKLCVLKVATRPLQRFYDSEYSSGDEDQTL